MCNFFNLVGFEYKKIFKRKGTVISLSLVTFLVVVSSTVIMFLPGQYRVYVEARSHARELAGRNIDETLFSEVKEAYKKISLEETPATEYKQYNAILAIMNSVYNFSGSTELLLNLPAEDMKKFYQIRHEQVSKEINALNISENAKEKLLKMDGEIKTPIVFDWTNGYSQLFTFMSWVGIFAAFVVGVCLAPMFAGEYETRADQLILSSKYGKNKLISAKLFTAVSFSAAVCMFIILLTYFINMTVRGFDGTNAPIQLNPMFFTSAYPLTMMKAAIIFFICTLFASILTGAITIFLSSIFKSPFGVIIIVSLLTFLPIIMVDIVEESALIYNLFRLIPVNMIGADFLMGRIPSSISHITYELFGQTIPPYIFLPIFAALVSAIILPFAYRSFKNHQIG